MIRMMSMILRLLFINGVLSTIWIPNYREERSLRYDDDDEHNVPLNPFVWTTVLSQGTKVNGDPFIIKRVSSGNPRYCCQAALKSMLEFIQKAVEEPQDEQAADEEEEEKSQKDWRKTGAIYRLSVHFHPDFLSIFSYSIFLCLVWWDVLLFDTCWSWLDFQFEIKYVFPRKLFYPILWIPIQNASSWAVFSFINIFND